jgi:hypothetical protein
LQNPKLKNLTGPTRKRDFLIFLKVSTLPLLRFPSFLNNSSNLKVTVSNLLALLAEATGTEEEMVRGGVHSVDEVKVEVAEETEAGVPVVDEDAVSLIFLIRQLEVESLLNSLSGNLRRSRSQPCCRRPFSQCLKKTIAVAVYVAIFFYAIDARNTRKYIRTNRSFSHIICFSTFSPSPCLSSCSTASRPSWSGSLWSFPCLSIIPSSVVLEGRGPVRERFEAREAREK